MLLDRSREHGMTLWNEYASRLQAVLAIKGGDLDTQDGGGRTPALTRSLSTTLAAGFIGETTEAYGRAGRIAEALAVIEAGRAKSAAGRLAAAMRRTSCL